jgi:hypothetical protein
MVDNRRLNLEDGMGNGVSVRSFALYCEYTCLHVK